MKKIVFFLMMIVLLSACGEYNNILKSTDYELKYSYAKKYFNEKKYSKAATLLDELVTIFTGKRIIRRLPNISRPITRPIPRESSRS